MQISKHFTLRETEKSQIAVRHNIDNTPPPYVIPSLQETAIHILEPVRDHFKIPFSPSSWYRCLKLNDLVGSKPSSQHILGKAVDIEIPTIPNIEIFHWIKDQLNFDQLILEFYNHHNPSSGWVHISWVNQQNNRNQAFEINK